MFNPEPRIQAQPLHDGHVAYVVDDVLADPGHWVARAQAHGSRFQAAGSAYPGQELWLDADFGRAYAEFFSQHLRTRLGARRVLSSHSRLSLVTTPPQALKPWQWICHRDNRDLPPQQCMVASVIYLFSDPALGGTSIYRPLRGGDATEALVRDSLVLDGPSLCQRYPGITPGYMVQGNPWFERVASLAPRYNRAVFYLGELFHAGDILHPGRMSADPARGRLTINGFLRCTRRAA